MKAQRLRRYEAAVQLAHEILAENPGMDNWFLAQAFEDIRDEVRAGRRNQAEFPKQAAAVRERLGFSVRVPDEPPRLTVIHGGGEVA